MYISLIADASSHGNPQQCYGYPSSETNPVISDTNNRIKYLKNLLLFKCKSTCGTAGKILRCHPENVDVFECHLNIGIYLMEQRKEVDVPEIQF